MTERRVDGFSPDSVLLYLNDIGRVPLLTGSEEVQLAQSIEAGRVAWNTAVSEGRRLTRPERRAFRNGLDDHQRFIESNTRLVVSIAKKYASDVPLADLIQEGNFGLMHAVEKFNWRKGFRFSTYATWWIRQSVTRGIHAQDSTIRIPSHVHEFEARHNRIRAQLVQKLQREPTDDEICDELEVEIGALNNLRESLQLATPMSLDQHVGDESETELYDLVPSSDDEYSDNRVIAATTATKIMSVARYLLSDSELAAYNLSSGLVAGGKDTPEISRLTGVEPTRIKYIHGWMRSVMHHPTVGIMAELDEAYAWQDDADCKETDVRIFFPLRGASVKLAKAMCEGCVQVDACKSLGQRQKHGIWAGETQRSKRRSRTKVKQTQPLEEALPPQEAVA